jgi:hypothetical protein
MRTDCEELGSIRLCPPRNLQYPKRIEEAGALARGTGFGGANSQGRSSEPLKQVMRNSGTAGVALRFTEGY